VNAGKIIRSLLHRQTGFLPSLDATIELVEGWEIQLLEHWQRLAAALARGAVDQVGLIRIMFCSWVQGFSVVSWRLVLFPLFAKRIVQPVTEGNGQFVRLSRFVERDRLADVVHNHLAWVAARHVFLELLADGRVNRAIHVFVQHCQHFFALHMTLLLGLSREGRESYKVYKVYMGKNTPERKDYIRDKLVVPVEE